MVQVRHHVQNKGTKHSSRVAEPLRALEGGAWPGTLFILPPSQNGFCTWFLLSTFFSSSSISLGWKVNSEKTTAEIISEKIGKHCCNILEGSRQELSTAYVLFTIDYLLTPAKSAAVHPRKGPLTACQKNQTVEQQLEQT